MIEDTHRCEDCGKLTTILNETDDYAWVCNDCYDIHQSLTDPDCNLHEPGVDFPAKS